MVGKSPLLVQLSINKSESDRLHDVLKQALDATGKFSTTQYDRKVRPVHCTLAFFTDTDLELAVDTHYKSLIGTSILIKIVGYVADPKCAAFLVELPAEIQVFPPGRSVHVTMLLKDKPPVYSNELIGRLSSKNKLDDDEAKVAFKETISIQSKLEIKYK